MPRSFTGPETEFLTRHLGESTANIVRLFNEEFENSRTYNSIQKRVKALREALSDVQETSDAEEAFEDMIQEAPELRVPHVTAAEKRAARKDAEEWLREIIDVSHREIGHLGGVIASRAVRSDNSSLVVVLSDLHFGKFTEHFNMEIARQRTRSIPTRLRNTLLPTLDEVVLVLLGDIVEGEDIYANQNGMIECPVFEQTQTATRTIWEMILLFRELFGCRVRVETVPGNHGRMSKTAAEKSNWDNVVYHILRVMAHLYKDPEIVVNANFKQFNTFDVKGHTMGIYHQGVKHASTPAMREKIAGWAVAKELDLFIHGHWHEWHIGNWLGTMVVANGCLCGADDLSEKMGKEDNPRQAWFLLEPDQPPHNFSFLEWGNTP